MKIAVLRPGLMGSQIACEYALGGHEVVFLARRQGASACQAGLVVAAVQAKRGQFRA